MRPQIREIVAKVEEQLVAAEQDGVFLKVANHRLDDDWLYVIVVPARPNVRASDHARLMSQIERNLRREGAERVLLVPALED